MRKFTRRLSRKILGLPKEEKKVDSRTRKILREAVNKAIFTPDEPIKRDIPRKPTESVTVTPVENSATHVNFNTRLRVERPERYTREYYNKDGRLKEIHARPKEKPHR
jgi:hypothetical protein